MASSWYSFTMSAFMNRPESGAQPPRQIRFVNNQGQPPSKRRRINAAYVSSLDERLDMTWLACYTIHNHRANLTRCLTCRRRKTRCDGERPLCSTCTKNGHKCQGYPEGDLKKDAGGELGGRDDDEYAIDEPPAEENGKIARLKEQQPLINITYNRMDKPPPKRPGSESPYARRREAPVRATIERSSALSDASKSPPHYMSHPSATTDDLPSSPTLLRHSSHRVPYFRYFGATAIVPGFKQMLGARRDRRLSTSGSQSGASPMSSHSGGLRGASIAAGSDLVVEEIPVYDPNSPGPVHPLILSLVKTFFVHLGCNYPFLKQAKFLRMVMEKRVEAILVDAVCALAARFSDSVTLSGGNDKIPRAERGQIFAQRAKQATVDTFPCPSVGAVQALLLMAYEGFGANQDSGLWMYLGLAIRMAVDLGLQKRIGVQYQGDKDPWYTGPGARSNGESESPEDRRTVDSDGLTLNEQKEVEQERIDTFWAVFFLDRVISSGTGRPVTFRDDDFEVPFPSLKMDPATGWPMLFPVLLEIIHLYGRMSDVLNNIHHAQDLSKEKWTKLSKMEHQLTRMYKVWDARLQFNVGNFKAYLNIGQGTTFILLHFWFHALFIVLHQPTLLSPFGELKSELQLLSDSRELSMSSAKTICDILSFADLIEPISFIGNPFTSQPIYIAACAFLMESSANASEGPSRESSPPTSAKATTAKSSRHSLLASAANQNYQRCYNSLQQMQPYWGGVKYILTALDQKAKGISDVETYTTEEYESTKPNAGAAAAESPSLPAKSPKLSGGPPIAWSLAGTANSPNSNLTLLYQNDMGSTSAAAQPAHRQQAGTPPGNMLYDPIRQSMPPEAGAMYPPAVPPTNLGGTTKSPRKAHPRRPSSLTPTMAQGTVDGGFSESARDGSKPPFIPPGYTPANQGSGPPSFDAFNASPSSNADGGMQSRPGNTNMYFGQHMPYQSNWGFGNTQVDGITFNSHDIDIGSLGLQQPDLMTGWLEYLPQDVLGLFENNDMGESTN